MPRTLVNLDNGAVISCTMEEARAFWVRMRGLLGRTEFPSGSALLIADCSSIHMFFMKFPIDVLFVDDRLRVLRIVPDLPVWRWASCPRACSTVELPAGTAGRLGIQVGHRLEIRE